MAAIAEPAGDRRGERARRARQREGGDAGLVKPKRCVSSSGTAVQKIVKIANTSP